MKLGRITAAEKMGVFLSLLGLFVCRATPYTLSPVVLQIKEFELARTAIY